MSKQSCLANFLKRRRIDSSESCSSSNTTAETSTSKNQPERLSVYHSKDIENFVNNKHITADKLDVINLLWVPPPTYTFPLLDKYNDKKVKLRFQHKWLIEFNWLSYSAKEKGAFCKFCVFFATTGGANSQTLGALVKTKMDNWKKAKEIFNSHQSTLFHKQSICAYENLAKIQEGVQESVIDLIDENRKKQVAQNRAKIKPIIEAVLVCGREEMSLRGHRDSGELKIDDSSANEGKFRAILKYRARGDAALRETLEKSSKRETYIAQKFKMKLLTV